MNWRRSLSIASGMILTVSLQAAAQCSMCATAATGQGAKAMRSLNFGIIFLLIPPVAIMTTILILAFRYRDEVGVADLPASPDQAVETFSS